MDAKQLYSMTTEALEALNTDLSKQRDALKAQQMVIKAELDKRAVSDKTAKFLAKLSPAEREALKAKLNA